MAGISQKRPGDQWAGAEKVRERVKEKMKWIEGEQLLRNCRQRFVGGRLGSALRNKTSKKTKEMGLSKRRR